MDKFETLMDLEGYTNPLEFIEAECLGAGWRVGVPAICVNDGCNYMRDMEPDQDGGWCEECQTSTVKSALILYGIL